MEHSTSLQAHFPELYDAINHGYQENFFLTAAGLIQCLSKPGNCYELNEVIIKFITCPILKATIYLIDVIDGSCRGTMVEYWEHFST